MGEKSPSKTLPYTLLVVSAIVFLLLIINAAETGAFTPSPIAIILFGYTGFVVWKTWFKKNSG